MATSSKTLVEIDIVCDMTCPYCWIGKRRLESAMGKLKDKMEFRLRWLPYQLRPDAPFEGMPIPPQYQNPDILAQLKGWGREVGLNLTYKYKAWPNTSRAHALLEMAGQRDGGFKQGEITELIYKTHFTDGVFLSEDVLVGIGQQAGYDPAEVKAVISDKVRLEAINKASEVNKNRVTGMIPVYFFNGEEMIVGAKTEEEFVDKLTLAAQHAADKKA